MAVPEVACFASLDEAARLAPEEPFVVRGAANREFQGLHDPTRILALLEDCPLELFGYGPAGATVDTTAAALFRAWQAGTLEANVVDAPFPPLMEYLPAETRTLLGLDWIALVLTRAPSSTALHYDPPELGGGFMALACGVKEWIFASAERAGDLFDPETAELREALPLPELKRRVPGAGWRQVQVRGGDFVYFPPGWPHAVETSAASVGVGGYWRRRYYLGPLDHPGRAT